MRSLRAVSELFPRTTETGLTDEQVADSRARFGANRLTPLPREPAWKKFLEKFDDPIIKILLAASLLKIVVDLFEVSPTAGGLGLGAVVAVLAVLGVARLGTWIPSAVFLLAGLLVGVTDVGLAMGISGTQVAKAGSKIVLLDDAFSTIVRGVHWGRSLYENIQRFIQFQLTINVSALLIAFLGPFLGLKPLFTVLQLLWINVIMDTFAAIALCSESPRANLMRRPPKRRDERILTPAMLGNIFLTAAFFVVVMIALLLGMQHDGWFAGDGAKSAEFPQLTLRQVTLFFSVYVFFQV